MARRIKKTHKRKQKVYKMKGCSKSRRRSRSCVQFGGTNETLAYPSNDVPRVPNPFLAYTDQNGGDSSPATLMPQNINGEIPYHPNTGPIFNSGVNTTTNQTLGLTRGGGQGLVGGSCGMCNLQLGGRGKMRGGNPGFIGKPWTTSPEGWPGVNNSRNYLDYNAYKVDPQTALIDVGANRPYLFGGKNRSKKMRRQNGGTLSNFLGQDLLNLGRQFQYGIGNTYNALNGYPSAVNPLPWKDQLPNTPSLSTIRGAAV
jgi:hypothetical protein